MVSNHMALGIRTHQRYTNDTPDPQNVPGIRTRDTGVDKVQNPVAAECERYQKLKQRSKM